jgi:hypothetical protein
VRGARSTMPDIIACRLDPRVKPEDDAVGRRTTEQNRQSSLGITLRLVLLALHHHRTLYACSMDAGSCPA